MVFFFFFRGGVENEEGLSLLLSDSVKEAFFFFPQAVWVYQKSPSVTAFGK